MDNAPKPKTSMNTPTKTTTTVNSLVPRRRSRNHCQPDSPPRGDSAWAVPEVPLVLTEFSFSSLGFRLVNRLARRWRGRCQGRAAGNLQLVDAADHVAQSCRVSSGASSCRPSTLITSDKMIHPVWHCHIFTV